MANTIYCSFCGKSEAEVFYLVGGPAHAGICDECVILAADVIQNQRARVARHEPIIRKKRTLAEFRAELRDQR